MELAERVPIALEMFVLIAKATNKDTDEPVHPLSFPTYIHTMEVDNDQYQADVDLYVH